MSLGIFLGSLIKAYSYVLIAYIVLSWFPAKGWAEEIRGIIEPLVTPFLAPFRKFLPSMGGVDFSPILAFFVLSLLESLIRTLFR